MKNTIGDKVNIAVITINQFFSTSVFLADIMVVSLKTQNFYADYREKEYSICLKISISAESSVDPTFAQWHCPFENLLLDAKCAGHQISPRSDYII